MQGIWNEHLNKHLNKLQASNTKHYDVTVSTTKDDMSALISRYRYNSDILPCPTSDCLSLPLGRIQTGHMVHIEQKELDRERDVEIAN